jgi:diguanylate cyclase (GGDEF)-like protein
MIKRRFTLPKYRTAILFALSMPVLYVISRYNYLLFHSFADGVSIVIAACVFTIIWNGRHLIDNDYFLYVGIAFLFFAFWDLMHLLGNKNMGVFPEYGNLGPALYIASRYILSISLIIAPLFINRKLNTTRMFAVYSLVTLFILLSLFYWQIFPVCIVDGVGLTPFKVVSDYIICMILLGAIGLLLINRRSFDSRVLWIIVSSIILSIATGLAFTLYADPFGIMNAVGHFFQIASFYLVFFAFIETSLRKPQDILYRKLKQNEEKLAENIKQLDNANVELKQEIAERKRAEEALREKEEQLRLLFENMTEGIALHELIYDESGKVTDYRILSVNPTYEIHTGISVERARGSLASDLYGTGNPPYLEEYTRVAQTGVPLSFETYLPSLEKHFFISAIPHGQGQFATVFMDITERKHLEEELREASLHDLLTGLHNRRGFFTLAEQQVKAAARARMKLSLTYLDCDDFKWVNDSLGHEQGDKVLVDTAHILRQTFRESDIIARIGGDEFVILSIEAADVDPEVFLKRLQQNIDEYNAKETRRYKLALSWGTVAYDPESLDSLDELLSQADRLMYRHKKDKANKQS